MTDVAALVFDIDSTAARSAATDLAKVQGAAASLAGEWSKTDRALRRSNGQFASSVDVVEKYGREVQQLAREFNPALNAVYQFQQAEERLNRAIALGVVSINEKDAALDRIRTSLAAAATAQTKFGKSTDVASHHAMNLGYQINDIGMMMSLGQNPFALMMQQGPQVAQIFSQMNAEGRKIGPTLVSAFSSLLNPTTAVTLALIGGTTALVQWGMGALGASEETRKFEDVVSEAISSIDRLNTLNKFFETGGINEMGAAYGVVTAQVRELIEAQRFLAQDNATRELAESIKLLKEETGTSFWQTIFGDTSGGVMVPEAIRDAENRVANLQSLLGLTANDAKSLGAAMEVAFNAKTIQDQISGLKTVREYLTIIAKAGGDSAAEAAKLLDKIVKAEEAALKLNAAAGKLPSAFNAAANAASKITDELNRAINAAAKLASAGISDVRRAQIELDFRTDPIKKAAALAAAQFDEEVGKNVGMDARTFNALRSQTIKAAEDVAKLNLEREKLDKADRDAEKSTKSGSGKAAAELKAAEKSFQSIRELLEKESVFQVAEWEKRQAQLDQALAKKLLTQQQYQEMESQLQTYYFGTEFEKRQLQYDMSLEQLRAHLEAEQITRQQYAIMAGNLHSQQVTELGNQDANRYSNDLGNLAKHMGEMNSIAGGGYDSLLKAQRVFGAASALISTYTGAAEALKLPFPYNIAAAGKIIAAGMGFVNAIKGGGSGGGGGGAAASAQSSAARAEPTKNILVRLEGPDYMVDMAEEIMTQIYEQSKSGRVIISRDN